jgi:hypothetical protein
MAKIDYKKDISRLRSEVRNLTQKEANPFTGIVSGNYWTQTGMPWVRHRKEEKQF